MFNKFILFFVSILIFSASCKNTNDAKTSNASHATASTKETDLADKVMEAMGGEENWKNLRFISWNFFGNRDLTWDKHTGRVRIEIPENETIFLLNVNTGEGRVQYNGIEETDVERVEKFLKTAKSTWINDSYWWTMPFKLQDPGVHLEYMRQDTLPDGKPAEVLQLTFENVGDTPENKYEVYIDKTDYLIKQWAYFKDASLDEANFIWPWDNYQSYNGVLISADRSNGKGPFNIKVFDSLPDDVFESF